MSPTSSDPVSGSEPLPHALLPVVGLGASAGGIQALKEFFANVPARSGVAWAVILHLSPDYESRLAEVLQTTAPMPVTQVTHPVSIERDHVYVIPPNKNLEIKHDTLVVTDPPRGEVRRAPVDVFFRALADAHGSGAICVVLSGTGPNGSAGLKRVKEYGGLAIAQDPSEAEYADMPRNAIATGLVDFVLPIAHIPERILTFLKGVKQAEIEAEEHPAVVGDEALRDILTLLRVRTGQDFSNYKTATVQRRIERRTNLRGCANAAEYAQLLRKQPDEAIALMKELLISVTNFFRDATAWAILEQRVIPRLFLNKSSEDQVRVWVPGCATGEEAYSIAMLLAEYAEASKEQCPVQVFGTDLDEQAIAIAREGFYSDAEVSDLSETRLQRFFHKVGGGYQVRRELREMLLFAHHNVIKDPPFSHLDLISCRNLLIYLNRVIQERVIETFHFALRPGGYLFLGTSESPETGQDLFMRFDPQAHVYEARSVATRLALPLAEAPQLTLPPALRVQEPRAERILPPDLHQRLLEEFAPPSLIVTEEHNIVHMSEKVGRYLHVPPGEPSRDLLRVLREELRPDVRTALYQAVHDHTRVDVRGVQVAFNGDKRAVDVTVRPVLREDDPARGYLVVMFHEHDMPLEAPEPSKTLERSAEPGTTRQLEDELTRLKGQLRLTVEQYETQAEEAKAGNEELQAMNEELRSSAEELETSKEELQSVNEELTTVNQELKIKIEELAATNNDFQNFINSTDIATVFLDRALRVKLFTVRAQTLFNLLQTDVGRPLTDITSRIRDARIHQDVRVVLETLQTIEREVQSETGDWYQLRVLPYRTTDNRIDGVVLTFQDTTARREAEQLVRHSEEQLRMLADSAIDYALFTLREDGRIASWNPGAERLFGYTSREAIGSSVEILFTPEDRAAGVPMKQLEQARRAGRVADECYYLRKDGTRFYVSGETARLGEDGIGFAKIARDLTKQREAAEALREAHAELEARVRQRTGEIEAQQRTVLQLLGRLVSAHEDERKRLALDLHDSLGQQLTTLRLALERHGEKCPLKDGDGAIPDALAMTRDIGREVDFLTWELRPPLLDELGLTAALPRFVEQWAAHTEIKAECRVDGFKTHDLSSDAQVAFYRLAQEALNNVYKHAQAKRVDVVLSKADSQVVLVVEDDGVGFDATDPSIQDTGVGLAGMRERALLVGATVEVESTPGKGTSVFVRAPVAAGPTPVVVS